MKKLLFGFIIGLFTTLIILIKIIIGKFSLDKIKRLFHILEDRDDKRFE